MSDHLSDVSVMSDLLSHILEGLRGRIPAMTRKRTPDILMISLSHFHRLLILEMRVQS